MTPEAKQTWRARCWVTHTAVGFGVVQYMAFHPDFPSPVGVVWVIGYGGKTPTADVLHAYTLPYFRRRGVCALIHEQLLTEYVVLRTGEGSKEGGAAFLHATGFTPDPVRGDWFRRRPGTEDEGGEAAGHQPRTRGGRLAGGDGGGAQGAGRVGPRLRGNLPRRRRSGGG